MVVKCVWNIMFIDSFQTHFFYCQGKSRIIQRIPSWICCQSLLIVRIFFSILHNAIICVDEKYSSNIHICLGKGELLRKTKFHN
jgi:hypothetical protein